MTTVELGQLLTRNTSVDDLAGCSAQDAMELIRVMNEGMQMFYKLAPTRWSRTGASALILEPTTVSCDVTANSTAVSNAPFTAAMRGCTAKLEGADTFNEIVSTNQLLHAWTGSTGTVTATVYYDAIAITDFTVEKIVNDPVIVETDKRLVRQEQFESEASVYPFRYGSPGGVGRNVRMTSTYPSFYRVNYVGNSYQANTGDAVVILMMDPLPLSKFNVRFDIQVRPGSYRIGALTTASDIPVDDSLAYSTLLPLCERGLLRSPIWNGTEMAAKAVDSAGQLAMETTRTLTAKRFARPKRRTRTKTGW